MYKRGFYCLQVMWLVSACVTPLKNRDEEFDFRIRQVEHMLRGQGYMLDIDRCGIDYLFCKDKKIDHKKCWARLEICVKDQYNLNELLKKKSTP